MGKRSTIHGYWRARGATEASSSRIPGPAYAVVPVVIAIRELDATADAGTGTGQFLPIGAIPLSVSVFFSTAAGGGTSPILDVGLEIGTPDDDGLADGLDYEANSNTQIGDALAGALLGAVMTEQAEITYGDDGVGTNNTSGEIDIFVTYTFDDDSSQSN